MIKIRKANEALVYGEYKLILENDKNIYAYERILENEKFIIITNMSNNNATYSYDKASLNYNNLIISNIQVNIHESTSEIELKPWECRMYKI